MGAKRLSSFVSEQKQKMLKLAGDLTPDELKLERVRRTKEMATKLFKEEIKPPEVLHTIKRKGFFVAVSLGALILVAVTFAYRVNYFITLEEDVFAMGAKVRVAQQRRTNLFSNIVNATLIQAKLESDLVKYIADSRSDLKEGQHLNGPAAGESKIAAPASGDIMKQLSSSLNPDLSVSSLMALVEQYPDIKFSRVYTQLIDKLVDIENDIQAKRTLLNAAVSVYNINITQVPWNIVALVTGFEREHYYEVTDESIFTPPLLTGEVMKKLLPAEADGNPDKGIKK
ncbi:MAG: LemA family protein [SAR324 cluster bacterium]|nr:LemA family protein [SAR324 cluster bacterium]